MQVIQSNPHAYKRIEHTKAIVEQSNNDDCPLFSWLFGPKFVLVSANLVYCYCNEQVQPSPLFFIMVTQITFASLSCTLPGAKNMRGLKLKFFLQRTSYQNRLQNHCVGVTNTIRNHSAAALWILMKAVKKQRCKATGCLHYGILMAHEWCFIILPDFIKFLLKFSLQLILLARKL